MKGVTDLFAMRPHRRGNSSHLRHVYLPQRSEHADPEQQMVQTAETHTKFCSSHLATSRDQSILTSYLPNKLSN